MKKKFILQILALFVFIFSFFVFADKTTAEECLSYEPAKVRLIGTIVEKTFPGPPEFESIEKGDRPETHWILKLIRPVCVNGDPKSELNVETEKKVNAVQLIIYGDESRYKHLLSRKIIATGTLFHAHTGHHHTKVLMEVISIRLEKDRNKK